MEILFIFVFIIFFIVNTITYKKILNFVNIINCIWTFFSVISMFGLFGMYVPENETYFYILIFWSIFQLFCLVFFHSKNPKNLIKNTSLNWDILKYVMIFCILFLGVFAIKGLLLFIIEKDFSAIKDANSNSELFSNKISMLQNILIIPLGSAIGIYSIIEYVENSKVRFTLFLYFIFIVEILFLTGGRYYIFVTLVIIILSLLNKYRNNILLIIQKNKELVIIMSIIFLLIIIITLQRNLNKQGLIFNIYAYFAGSIHLLGEYLRNPNIYFLNSNDILYGQVLISGFFYPITFILRLCGIDIKAGVYILKEVTNQFIQISSYGITINNGVTCIYAALRDFGKAGLIIYPIILAFFGIDFYKKEEKSNNIYYKAMYYYYICCLIFCILEFTFALPSTIFTFIFFRLLVIVSSRRKVNEKKFNNC